jgi:hypothetical protein
MVVVVVVVVVTMNIVCYYKVSAFQVTSLLGYDAIYIRYRYQILGVNLCLYLQDSLQYVQEKSFIAQKNIL